MADLKFDEKDFHILRKLDEEGDIDVEEISDELGVSTSTIYYRLEKYRDKGLLKEGVTRLDPETLGLNMTAISEIKSEYGPGYEGIGERLKELSGVHTVYFMLGQQSFMVISQLRDHAHLQQLVDEIIHTDGVEHSATSIVLKTLKDEPRLLVNYEMADLRSIFGLSPESEPELEADDD